MNNDESGLFQASVLNRIPLLSRRHIQILSELLMHRFALVGLAMLAIVIICSLFAPMIAPYDPTEPIYSNTFAEPSSQHLFGTDNFGRDLFSRVVFGTRISLKVGLAVVFFALLLGVPIGLIAGFYSNTKLESLLMRFMDAILSFPSIILALTLLALLGGSLNNVILALSITNTPVFARLVRGSVLSVREETYVESAQAIGTPNRRIILRHILPNVLSPIIVQGTLVFAFAIIAEAALSFLGIGAQPPTPSWGLMLSTGQQFLNQSIWISVFPGVSIMITVLSLNFVGDALQDVLDPKESETELR